MAGVSLLPVYSCLGSTMGLEEGVATGLTSLPGQVWKAGRAAANFLDFGNRWA